MYNFKNKLALVIPFIVCLFLFISPANATTNTTIFPETTEAEVDDMLKIRIVIIIIIRKRKKNGIVVEARQFRTGNANIQNNQIAATLENRGNGFLLEVSGAKEEILEVIMPNGFLLPKEIAAKFGYKTSLKMGGGNIILGNSKSKFFPIQG